MRARSVVVALVLGVSNAISQEMPSDLAAPAPPSPFDRVVTVTPGEPFEYTAEFSGSLFVWSAWAPGDPSLVLHVDDATDDGDGARRAPCLDREVHAGMRVAIVVHGGSGDEVRLQLIAAPETEATRAAAAAALSALNAIDAVRHAGDSGEARRRLEAQVELLLGTAGAEWSDAVADAAWDCGRHANLLALDGTAARAWGWTLRHLRRALPDDNPELAAVRQNVAVATKRLGNLSGARVLEEQVLAVRLRTLPEDHPHLALARQNLAVTMKRLGDLRGALALEEQVLAARTRTLPEEHPDLATARGNLAITMKRLGDLRGARALEEQVLAVRTRTLPEDDRSLIAARENLAVTLMELGDLRGARSLQTAALASLSRILPEDHPDLAMAQGNLANTSSMLGDAHGALALLERALATWTKILPEDHPDLVAARQNLAGTLQDLGEWRRARVLHEQVLTSRERTLPEDHPHLVAARSNLAMLLRNLGDLHGARALFEQVLEARVRTLPDDHPDLIRTRQSIAELLRASGDLQGARALFEQVVALQARTLPDDHPDAASARQGLATTRLALGDVGGARALFEEVLAARKKALPDDHPDVARALRGLAAASYAAGDVSEARRLLETSLARSLESLPEEHQEVARARQSLALTLIAGRTGSAEDASSFMALARDHARSLSRTMHSAWLEGSTREVEERFARAADDVGIALSLAQGADAFEPDGESLAAVFAASECTRAAAVLASVAMRTARAHPRYAEAHTALADARAAVAHVGRAGVARDDVEVAIARREEAERELRAITLEAVDADVFGRVPQVADFAEVIGADEAAIAYRRCVRWRRGADRVLERDEFCAFVVRSDAKVACIDLGPAAPIEAAIDAWRSATAAGAEMASRSRPAIDEHGAALRPADGESLRRLVWDPVVPAIGGARRIVLVADDVLHAIPFDALPIDGRLLGERVMIAQRLTLVEGLLRQARSPGTSRLAVVGDAAFGPVAPEAVVMARRGGPSPGGFQPLPHTSGEALGIAELFGEDATVLAGAEVTRPAVEALSREARFLHLATHGWFAPESVRSTADAEIIDPALGIMRQSSEDRIIGSSPMVLCGLALAGANLPPDELGRYPGLVTAEEIAGWDLSNCELAVLSACDTNVGLRRAGQGVSSLQKALHMAGARSVITSLWKVPDKATKELMLDFYRRLWVEKKPKHQALWEAKMRIRDAKDERGAPRYTTRDWAAWVLTGDPD